MGIVSPDVMEVMKESLGVSTPEVDVTIPEDSVAQTKPIVRELELRSDIEYEFTEIHNSPMKDEFYTYLKSIPGRLKTREDKRNWKTIQKPVSHNPLRLSKEKTFEVTNIWHKYLTRNSKCPCGSGKKWKKCHMDIMSPYVPVEVYMEAGKKQHEEEVKNEESKK